MVRHLDFVKGHMGGNEIVLLCGSDVPYSDAEKLKLGLKALFPPYLRGHQAGFLLPGEGEAHLYVKIVNAASRSFMPMCGGLLQVLGKALLETDISAHFGVSEAEAVVVGTDIGCCRIEFDTVGDQEKLVWAEMKPFVEKCYALGVQHIKVAGIKAMRVGEFLVVCTDDVYHLYPELDFERIDAKALDVLADIQRDFDRQGFLKHENTDFALYDLSPKVHSNTGRVIFPHKPQGEYIEPACGTGTIAVAIALVETRMHGYTGKVEFRFESGGSPFNIGGPDLTTVKLYVKKGRVVSAAFSHSLVEILATGKIYI